VPVLGVGWSIRLAHRGRSNLTRYRRRSLRVAGCPSLSMAPVGLWVALVARLRVARVDFQLELATPREAGRLLFPRSGPLTAEKALAGRTFTRRKNLKPV
jgi:hypothetical protein